MIKNILLIFTFLLLVTKSSSQECGYIEYYSLVNAAAEDYSDKKYKKAEEKLKLAFSKTKFPLGKGLSLALLVAQERKDADWAEQIAIELAKGGVPLKYFRNLKSFNWYEKFKTNFKNYSDYYNQNYNPELREELLSLLERDKKFNSKCHKWRTREIEMTLQELIDGASKILSDFKKLTDEYGFPNEQLMGFNYVHRKNSIDYYHIDVLMIHIYQRGVLIFKEEIRDIVCNGGLHPNYEEILKEIRGFGDSSGIEQEMKIRYAKYRDNK